MSYEEIFVPETGNPANTFVDVAIRRGQQEAKQLLELIDGYGFIAGGYARWMCSPRSNGDVIPAGDVDVFCYTPEKFEELSAQLGEPTGESDAAIWYTKEQNIIGYPLQLIKPVVGASFVGFGTVEDVLRSFDYNVICVAVEPNRKKGIAHHSFRWYEENKLIDVLGITHPVRALTRWSKYKQKGYSFNKEMAHLINILDKWAGLPEEEKAPVRDFFTLSGLSAFDVEEAERLLFGI